MRTKMIGLAVALIGGLGLTTAASAAPWGADYEELDTFGGPRVERVADGCGPGFHRNPWGHCRPNDRGWGYGQPRGYYGPPRVYGGYEERWERPRPRYFERY